jgi:hypothetical protein
VVEATAAVAVAREVALVQVAEVVREVEVGPVELAVRCNLRVTRDKMRPT